jgi:hypothetical protein
LTPSLEAALGSHRWCHWFELPCRHRVTRPKVEVHAVRKSNVRLDFRIFWNIHTQPEMCYEMLRSEVNPASNSRSALRHARGFPAEDAPGPRFVIIAFTRFFGHGCDGCHDGGTPLRLPFASARGSPARGPGWPARPRRAKEANPRSGSTNLVIEIESKKTRRTRALTLRNCVVLGRPSPIKAPIARALIYQYSMFS